MAAMTKLGKYVIGRSLGKGAMGTVYEAFDPVIQRTVAIKTVLPSQLGGAAEAAGVLARFRREAQAAGRLNHPGIVAVYDYGEETAQHDATMMPGPLAQPPEGERVAFIAMEFVEGRELKSFFDANERFSLDEIARIMGDILSALEHAHAKGVTHRDIKPGNLIMLADGRVKVADFGIARIETSELTQVGEVMGTPSYMSPEQFQGLTVDSRSDIFSCGVILYQFLTGEKPFVGNTTTIMYKVLGEEPRAPSALNMALPPAWDQLVGKAIAKNPDHRFQTAGAFAQAIRETMASQASRGVDMNQTLAVHLAAQPNASIGTGTPGTTGNTATAPREASPGKLDQTVVAARPAAPKATSMAIAGVLVLLCAAGAYLLSGTDQAALPPAPSATPASPNPSPATAASPVPPTEQAKDPVPVTAAASAPAAAAPGTTTPVAVGPPPVVEERKVKPAAKPSPAPVAPSRPARPTEAQAPVEPPSARPVRCALILQKAAMSEPMSAEERLFLSSSCQ